MTVAIPDFMDADSIRSQPAALNDAGFLVLRNVFERAFLGQLRTQLARPYRRFFVNVKTDLYSNPEFLNFVSLLVGCDLRTCAKHDRQTSWVRLYSSEARLNPFSHFHIDSKRYRGRQFRVVVSLFDDSDCEFQYRSRRGEIVCHRTEPNSLCVIEAGRLVHRVQMNSGTRLLLMMDFTTALDRGPLGWVGFAWDHLWVKAVAGSIETRIDPNRLPWA